MVHIPGYPTRHRSPLLPQHATQPQRRPHRNNPITRTIPYRPTLQRQLFRRVPHSTNTKVHRETVPSATSSNPSRLGGYNSATTATKRRHTDPAPDNNNHNSAQQSETTTRRTRKQAPTKRHRTRSHTKTVKIQASSDSILPPQTIGKYPPTHLPSMSSRNRTSETAKKAPMHSPNSPVAQQQINSPVIPNLLSQPRAEPRTTFRERAPPSSSIHYQRPRPPRPTTAILQPTTTRLPHPHRNPVASEGTQRQTPQPSHRNPMVHLNPSSAPY